MNIINNRRSVREYTDRKVDKREIELILRAAMQAPSARNQQPWQFLVVQDQETREKCSMLLNTMSMVKNASFIIVFMTDKRNLKTEAMYAQDMAASVTLSLLEATSLGIGSCWCGVYPREDRMKTTCDLFNIPEYLEPFAIVAYGYPKNAEAFKFDDRYTENKVHYGCI